MKRLSAVLAFFAGIVFTATSAAAQSPAPAQSSSQRLELDRGGATVVLEPYAPNILRVTLSLRREPAEAGPGYGVVAVPEASGWSATQTTQADVYQSARIAATVDRYQPSTKPPIQTQVDIGKYFNGSTPGAHITLRTPEGKKLLEMTGWSQAKPNQKDGTADVLRDRRPTDAEFFTVGDRKSTRLNSSHLGISYAVFCLKK